MMSTKRMIFIFQHSFLALVLMIFAYAIDLVFSETVVYILLGLTFLVAKEYGEVVGKLKTEKNFKNTLSANFEAFMDSIDNSWKRWQSFGSAAIAGLVFIIIKGII